MSYADQLVEQLKKRVQDFQGGAEVQEIGTVIEVKDGIARMRGLDRCQAQEMLEFPGEVFGIALNLEDETVGAVILGPYSHIKEGDTVKRTGPVTSVPVGAELVGRVVDAVGIAIDDGKPLATKEFLPVERIAPGVMTREPVNRPMQTGIKSIDALIPTGLS